MGCVSGHFGPVLSLVARDQTLLQRPRQEWLRTAILSSLTLSPAGPPAKRHHLFPRRACLLQQVQRRTGTARRTGCSSTGPQSRGQPHRTARTRAWPSCWLRPAQKVPGRVGRSESGLIISPFTTDGRRSRRRAGRPTPPPFCVKGRVAGLGCAFPTYTGPVRPETACASQSSARQRCRVNRRLGGGPGPAPTARPGPR